MKVQFTGAILRNAGATLVHPWCVLAAEAFTG